MANLFGLSAVTMGIIIGAALLVIILIIAFIGIRNTLVRLRNNVEEGYATIDVYLKKRYDLIPNLVETVKGYTKHESGTLEAVINARNNAIQSSGEGRFEAENALSAGIKGIFALAESYPQLKADSQFLNLQNQLNSIETDLAQSRKYYNANVKILNTKIEVFPSNIVAGLMKLKRRPYFETLGEERQNVKVSF